MKIELPLFDLKYDKIAEPIAHTLELLDNKIVYHFECYMDKYPDEEDESNGWLLPKEGVYENILSTSSKPTLIDTLSAYLSGRGFGVLSFGFDIE